MASGKIMKRAVDALTPGEFLHDIEVRGFGCKCTSTGKKVYFVQYRMGGRGTPTERFTIGKHGSPWTADGARDEAIRLLGMVKGGTSPAAHKRAQAEARE